MRPNCCTDKSTEATVVVEDDRAELASQVESLEYSGAGVPLGSGLVSVSGDASGDQDVVLLPCYRLVYIGKFLLPTSFVLQSFSWCSPSVVTCWSLITSNWSSSFVSPSSSLFSSVILAYLLDARNACKGFHSMLAPVAQ